MALLERVKERTKSDLSDEELQRLIDEAEGEIVRRYGALPVVSEESAPSADPVSIVLEGGGKNLFLTTPLDLAQLEDLEIVEEESGTETELVDTDYRIWNGGRRLERLSTGTNPRSDWAELVTVSYYPVDTQNQRDEVTIKLVKLSIDYEGVKSDSVDGYSADYAEFTKERETLLASLSPTRVLLA